MPPRDIRSIFMTFINLEPLESDPFGSPSPAHFANSLLAVRWKWVRHSQGENNISLHVPGLIVGRNRNITFPVVQLSYYPRSWEFWGFLKVYTHFWCDSGHEMHCACWVFRRARRRGEEIKATQRTKVRPIGSRYCIVIEIQLPIRKLWLTISVSVFQFLNQKFNNNWSWWQSKEKQQGRGLSWIPY